MNKLWSFFDWCELVDKLLVMRLSWTTAKDGNDEVDVVGMFITIPLTIFFFSSKLGISYNTQKRPW